ncbi:alpha-amylase family protein [Planomonospora corallina]|uniref:Alpha-amylase family protein n=1 Tax=Planomonospora corallina TaxID=1806052 RepID=A0ABV8I816_9ACTN
MAPWAEHAIWWQVYPLGFTGAETSALPPGEPARHRLRHVEAWLDYAVELGCSGLLLGPVFASETHGYDTVDHFRIDPRLGDDADFDRLASAARGRGLHLLLDGVFNHVGRSFPVFARAAGDPRAAAWFRRETGETGAGGSIGDAGGTGEYATFEGHHRLVALDHDEPAVLDHVVRVMDHWLARGASGWRLDAAYAVPARFWRAALDRVRPRHPHAWFVGEVIHGDYAGYVHQSGLDSVTQYELWKAIWSSLNDGNLHELAWTLQRHVALLETFTPLTFVGNHDVTRLASRLTDRRHLGHALAVLFTVGGVPSVYYGDEQGLTGVKEEREGGDDAVRPVFPATPGELPPSGRPVHLLHRRLIGLRRRHPWLVRARTALPYLDNRAAALESADPADPGHRLLTLLNLDDRPRRLPVETGGLAVLESSGSSGGAPSPADPAVVPAHGWTVLGRA